MGIVATKRGYEGRSCYEGRPLQVMNVNSINISSKISAQQQPKLLLTPGQVISAQVIKSEGNQLLLQYGSYLFKAETGLVLKPGERLKLSVESTNDNIINLKIIDESETKRPENTTLLTPGQKPDQNMEAVARQLMKFNLPVNLEVITELNKFIKKNKLPVDIGQLVIWLKAMGIDVDSQQDIKALQVLQKFFQGELALDQEPKYFDLLNAAENQYAGGLNIYGWPLGQHHVYLIKEGSKSENLLPDSCKLAIKVDSAALQELWFVIELANNTMTANILCTNEKYKNILDMEAVNLKAALEGAGYLVKDLTIKVDKSKTTIFDLLPEQEISNVNLQV
jgi:hypothetical protein